MHLILNNPVKVLIYFYCTFLIMNRKLTQPVNGRVSRLINTLNNQARNVVQIMNSSLIIWIKQNSFASILQLSLWVVYILKFKIGSVRTFWA